ncbi:MAG: hypothetical protein MK033_08090 [Candidatus Caenarcaniphilales bacterium]|nr:hypothetical protein [Candidatus Caenarcaniphilales bacterium]
MRFDPYGLGPTVWGRTAAGNNVATSQRFLNRFLLFLDRAIAVPVAQTA